MEIAIVGLLLVIGVQFAYIIYSDRENRREREKMGVLIKSNDVVEYKDAIAPPDPDTPESREEYQDIEDVDAETLLKAEDNL